MKYLISAVVAGMLLITAPAHAHLSKSEYIQKQADKILESTNEQALLLLPELKEDAAKKWEKIDAAYDAAHAPVVPATTEVTSTTTTESTEAAYDTDSSGVNWLAIADCESGDHDGQPPYTPVWTINTGNGYYGGLQFSLSTWNAYGGQRYAAYPHLASASEQIAVASGMALSHWPNCGVYG